MKSELTDKEQYIIWITALILMILWMVAQ
jgi:hypothetical protein